MDLRTWKKTILQWVTQCGFLDRNYFNIEQSDIEAFYRKFCKYHGRMREASAGGSRRIGLVVFLRDNYPDFTPILDDENALSAVDYVYVYSLLLHYSCVKYPEAYFHEMCKKLSEESQHAIATFFKQLLECNAINKENLRHTISNIASPQTSPSLSESASGTTLSPSAMRVDSPVRTPRRQAALQMPPHRISPTTPKTILLEERTRELYNLRALLETERYEKGLLEVQIKQNDDKLKRLTQDHKKLLTQIHDLKNEVMNKHSETSTPNRDNDEQIKRRLCKEITQKEQEISKLTDILSGLNEEKHLIQEKLIFSEKKVSMCMDRIEELDQKVDELATELEQKTDTIKYLTTTKHELEQFIAESRSSRCELNNSSIDCLDASFSRSTNSSGSNGNGENLGSSVIDIQLREKTNENYKLREEITAMRTNNTHLAKALRKLALQQSEEFNITIQRIPNNDENYTDPNEQFHIFSNCMNKFTKAFKDEQNTVKQLHLELHVMENKNTELDRKMEDCQKEISMLNDIVHRFESCNSELEKNKNELQEKLAVSEIDIKTLNTQKFDLVAKLESLANEFDMHIESCKAQQKDFIDERAKLQIELQDRTKKTAELTTANLQLKDEILALQTKMHSLQEKLITRSAQSDVEIKTLNDKLASQRKELEAHQEAEQLMKEKYEKLLIQFEASKKDARETDGHLDAMRNEIAVKEAEMAKIGAEIIEVSSKNTELEQRIDKLINQFKYEKQTSDITINKREEQIKEIEIEKTELQKQLEVAHKELKNSKNELENLKDESGPIYSRFEAIHRMLDTTPIKNDVLANIDKMSDEIKKLLDQKIETANHIESLEFDNLENNAIMKMIEEQMQKDLIEKDELLKKQVDEIKQATLELEISQEKIDSYEVKLSKLREEQNEFVEKMQREIQDKEDQYAGHLKETTTEYQQKLDKLQLEIEEEREKYLQKDIEMIEERNERVRKERDIILTMAELNNTKQRLQAVKHELMQVQDDTSEITSHFSLRIHKFEEDLHSLAETNYKLCDEIKLFKEEHVYAVSRLRDADRTLSHLNGQLTEESKSNTQLSLKLKASEMRLLETEIKLDNAIKEKAAKINEMQMAFDEQNEKYEKEIEKLEKIKNENCETIDLLENKLKQVNDEKERLLNDEHEYTTNVQRIQEEKSSLLKSFEKSTEQLRSALDERVTQTIVLEERCSALQIKLHDVISYNSKLQNDIISKETELRVSLEEQQNERENWHKKLTELMDKVHKQSEQLEKNEIEMIEIVSILESNTFLKSNHFYRGPKMLMNKIPLLFDKDDMQKRIYSLQLRRTLNRMIENVATLHLVTESSETKYHETIELAQLLNKSNKTLTLQIKRYQKEMTEFEKTIRSEAKKLENTLTADITALNDEIKNLVDVNKQYASDIETYQCKLSLFEAENVAFVKRINDLNAENQMLNRKKIDFADRIDQICERERHLLDTLNERNATIDDFQLIIRELKQQLVDCASKIDVAFQEKHDIREKYNYSQFRIQQLQEHLTELQKLYNDLNEQYRQQQLSCDKIETDINEKSKTVLILQSKNNDLENERTQLENDLKYLNSRFDDAVTCKVTAENRCEHLLQQIQQLRHEIQLHQSLNDSLQSDFNRLMTERGILRTEKFDLGVIIKDMERENVRVAENAEDLLQGVGKMRIEKETVAEENKLLKRQLDERDKYQNMSQCKMREVMEKSQTLERKLLASENEVKTLRNDSKNYAINTERMSAENVKLRAEQEQATKRIEKMALKLGESQSKCSKLEREIEKLNRTLEAYFATEGALNHDKEVLANETKSLKERLAKADRLHDQLLTRIQNLEITNRAIDEAKQKIEASDLDAKARIIKLEKIREQNEEKIRKISSSLNSCENSNVRLNLEIGAINSEIAELKKTLNESEHNCEKLQKLSAADKVELLNTKKLNEELHNQIVALQESNLSTNDELSKYRLLLENANKKCTSFDAEMNKLTNEYLEMRNEKMHHEEEHIKFKSQLQECEMMKETLLARSQAVEKEFLEKIKNLHHDLKMKNDEVDSLQDDVNTLRQKLRNSRAMDDTKLASTTQEIENMRTRLNTIEELYDKEQQISQQLRLDNQILQAKYRDAKKRAEDESKASEERIKNNRLELEGKLEKMKNKMTQCRSIDIGGATRIRWTSRIKSCIKYLFIVLVSQVLFALIINYFMTRHDLEFILRNNRPTVF